MAKLEAKTSVMTEKIKADLKLQGVSLTHDGWTSNNTQSYDTVTCHMINDSWEMRSAVLETSKVEGQHTGENIAKSLQGTIETWKLGAPVAVTTDNAANEQKAVRLLGLTRFGCFGHRVNLVVKKSLQTGSVPDMLKKGRALVNFFHKSSSANDLLMEKQRLLTPSKIERKLIIDCPTRWNSTLPMITRLMELTPVLASVADDDRLPKSASATIKGNMYTYDEQHQLQELVKVLKPFETVTTILCSQKSPTMQHVCAATKKLERDIGDHESDSDMIKGIKSTMRTELMRRTEIEDLPLLAALLNPDTKGLPFLSAEERERSQVLLREKAAHINVEVKVEFPQIKPLEEPKLPSLPSLPDDETPETIEPPTKKQIMCLDSIDWLEDVCVVAETKESNETMVEAEIKRYMTMERQDTDSSLTLLQWWKQNQLLFPRLAKLARAVLAVPASSVPSERVFSLAGNIVSKKRSRLNPELVNRLIFLNMNMDLYW